MRPSLSPPYFVLINSFIIFAPTILIYSQFKKFQRTMALIKGFSVIEGLKGKLGNVVIQKGQNGEQVVRSYTSEVKNPKTLQQSNQRMKVAPAQHARRAMKSIVDHSFEGITYGTKSLNHFLSLAMKNNSTPAQMKGSMLFVPGKYVMATGSLPLVNVEYVAGEDGRVGKFNSSIGFEETASSTVAGFSEAILKKNEWLQNGDIITICFVKAVPAGDTFTYIFGKERLVIDSQSQANIAATNKGFYEMVAGASNTLSVVAGTDADTVGGNGIQAVAVIVSRLSGTNWLRSNSTMAVSPAIENAYYSASAIENAQRSYMSVAKNVTSDYYMNASAANILRGVVFNVSEITSYPSYVAALAKANIAGAVINEQGNAVTALFVRDWNGTKGTLVDTDGNPLMIDDENPATTEYVNAGFDYIEWEFDNYKYFQ